MAKWQPAKRPELKPASQNTTTPTHADLLGIASRKVTDATRTRTLVQLNPESNFACIAEFISP
jgi:hypothetical protein